MAESESVSQGVNEYLVRENERLAADNENLQGVLENLRLALSYLTGQADQMKAIEGQVHLLGQRLQILTEAVLNGKEKPTDDYGTYRNDKYNLSQRINTNHTF